jgi:Tol biopolymer transport system component
MNLRVFLYALFAAFIGPLGVPAATSEPMTERVSVDSSGAQANSGSISPAVSADGRFVAFASMASNLVAGAGTNSRFDVFVRDRQTGATERVSVDSAAGTEADNILPAVSADGRFVAFVSVQAALLNSSADVLVRDRATGQTERMNVQIANVAGTANSISPAISADGRFVAFASNASNLVAGDTNNSFDVFVRDRQTGTTERVSVDSTGAEGNFFSSSPVMSADGRFVAFVSAASNLVAGDTNNSFDVFVRDRQTGATERVSVDSAGRQANNSSGLLLGNEVGLALGLLFSNVAISADGRFVAFASAASNLVAGDTNGSSDVFVRDRATGQTERVSVDSTGAEGNFFSLSPAVSADGRFVAFASAASNLVAGDTNGGVDFRAGIDVFVHDRATGQTERVSVDSTGAQANSAHDAVDGSLAGSGSPAISADGRFVAFDSAASNLVAGDTNGRVDVFVRDRGAFADTIPPTLTVPGAITVDAVSPAGAVVTFAVSATDNVDPDVPVTCTPASGSLFPVGTTTVRCNASDDAGNTATATFDVLVRPFIVRLAGFAAKVEVEALNEVEVKTTFQLGAASNGIDPTREDVILRLGSLAVTIAAGSFIVDEQARFRFEGVVDGVSVEAHIRSLKTGGFEFKAELAGAAAASIGMRVEVSLTVGDDTGTTVAAVHREMD